MALTPVDMIIKELCRETGEPEYRNYDAFVGHIRRAFAQINIAAVQIVKQEDLPINNYNAIDWPCSCINPIMVGIRRNGRIITIDLDESIPRTCESNCSSISEAEAEIDRIANGHNPDYRFQVNENGELYGLGPGFNASGYCQHDRGARQTYIKGHYKEDDEFVFVFLSDGISDGLEYVPVETENALRAFGFSEYYRVKNPGLSAKEWDRYTKEVTFLRKLYQSRTAEGWTEAFRHNEKSSPK